MALLPLQADCRPLPAAAFQRFSLGSGAQVASYRAANYLESSGVVLGCWRIRIPQDFLHSSNAAVVGEAGAMQPLAWLIEMNCLMQLSRSARFLVTGCRYSTLTARSDRGSL